MNYRNVFGELEYKLGDFFIPHRTGNTGQYCILKREPWYITDARFADMPWDVISPFDSWIQAVKFLKENHKDLL